MKHYFTTILTIFFVLNSCAQATKSSASFQALMDTKAKESVGVLLAIYAPEQSINWKGAAGFDSKKKENKLVPKQPFRIASITKTFTATAILRLSEMGKLNINDPIDSYISEKHKQLLKQDNYDVKAITIKHCLQHISGIFDYAMGSQDYVAAAMKTPNKRWTRTEQIQFAINYGSPVGKPGEVYHYSDTGYVLLGEIIERLTGKGLAEANRELIGFNKIGLSNTWLEGLEPAPKGSHKKARAYFEDLDTTDWDNSMDLYGGGGYVSTTEDLVKFYHHLFNNKIFKKPETLAIMLSSNGITKQGRKAGAYKMGLWEINTPHGKGYMHNGFWGSAVVHFPVHNATIGVYYVDKFDNDLMRGALMEIVKHSEKD